MFPVVSTMLVASLVFAASVAPAAQSTNFQSVPNFNVDPSCATAAREAPTHPTSGNSKPDLMATCKASEQKAREDISKQWSQVSASTKAKCVPLSTLGGTPTYTELLTCIELTREAMRLREHESLVPLRSTTGEGVK